MREKGKRQKAVARVEILEMPKQGLIVAGADAHTASELRRQGWGYLLNCNRFGIVNHAVALKANLQGNLEIFDNEIVSWIEQRTPDCQSGAVASEGAIQPALEDFHRRFVSPIKTLGSSLTA